MVNIAGVAVDVAATADRTPTSSLVTLKKSDQVNLTPDKQQELFERITAKGQLERFRLQSLSIDLQETYNLQLSLTMMETIFT